MHVGAVRGRMYARAHVCECTRTCASTMAEGLACCRYVATDMSSWRGHKTTEQGAQTPVWLSLHAPLDGTGKFYSDCKEEPF